MDRIEPERDGNGDGDEADGAEAAFAALRREVAALRRGVELVYRQGEDARLATTPADYSPTLGAISQQLAELQARLQAIEAKPGMMITPAALDHQVAEVTEASRRELERTQGQLAMALRDVEGLIGQVRTREAQQASVITIGSLGVLAGLCLWVVLIRVVLPASAGAWLAALPVGGGPWQAGAAMMQQASPASWARMVRLYQACPADSAVEKCEAAMTTPAPAPAEAAKASNPTTTSAMPHARTGR